MKLSPETRTSSLPGASWQGKGKATSEPVTVTEHTRVQSALLKIGAEMGFDVWVARNDRSKLSDGVRLDSLPKCRGSLPLPFDEATNKTIELIDVLWLRGNTIVAAFEIE